MEIIKKIKKWDEDFCGKEKHYIDGLGRPYTIQPHPFSWLFSRAVMLCNSCIITQMLLKQKSGVDHRIPAAFGLRLFNNPQASPESQTFREETVPRNSTA